MIIIISNNNKFTQISAGLTSLHRCTSSGGVGTSAWRFSGSVGACLPLESVPLRDHNYTYCALEILRSVNEWILCIEISIFDFNF